MDNKNNNYYDNTSVLELTDADFEGNRIINKNIVGHYGLLKCYAPWCPHCKDLINPLMFLANGLKKEGFKIVSVNSEKTQNICNNIGVQGFPTLFLINPDGTLKDYNSDRSIEGILSEICKHTNSETCCRRERDEIICERNKN